MDKHSTNGSGETLVTFRLPAEVEATTVCVVGEFNGWAPDAHRMRREDDAFSAVIPLLPGRAYRFRYLLDGERWQNDWSADAYVPNEYGGDDSVVDLTDLPPVELPASGSDRGQTDTPSENLMGAVDVRARPAVSPTTKSQVRDLGLWCDGGGGRI